MLTNLCLLFNDCLDLDEELCPECLSGQQGCIPDDPVCNIQGYCSGVLDHFEELASLEDCLQLCQSSFGCRWVTYEAALSDCLLYKTCPSLDESCNNCLSSERRCIDHLTTTTEDTTTTDYVTTTEDSTTTTTELATTTITTDVTTPSPTGNILQYLQWWMPGFWQKYVYIDKVQIEVVCLKIQQVLINGFKNHWPHNYISWKYFGLILWRNSTQLYVISLQF